MKKRFIAILGVLLAGSAFADVIVAVKDPDYLKQMGYKISQTMPCNWNPDATTIFGYYGEPGKDSKDLFQKDLSLPHAKSFGLNLNMEFTPEMMEHDGMALQRVEIDFKPLNERCDAGFSPEMMTR